MDMGWTKLADGLSPELYIIQGRDWIGPNQMIGVLLTIGVKAGEPLPIAAILGPEHPQFLTEALRPGMRAISVIGAAEILSACPAITSM